MEKNIPEILEIGLPNLIRKIAKDSNIQQFVENPDYSEKRLEKWHQFGLLEHTKKTRQVFLNEMPFLLKTWQVFEKIKNKLSEKIDDAEKILLFEISIPLHDLGKISVFNDERTNREHEIQSKILVHQDFLSKKLKSLGLSEKQINYIAECIEKHDILGKELRDRLKHENNLNLDYFSNKNQEVIKLCKEIENKYPDLKAETGIFFICDTLGKTDVRIIAETDEDILNQEQEILGILRQRKLSPELKHAVMQLPINMKIAEVYLKSLDL